MSNYTVNIEENDNRIVSLDVQAGPSIRTLNALVPADYVTGAPVSVFGLLDADDAGNIISGLFALDGSSPQVVTNGLFFNVNNGGIEGIFCLGSNGFSAVPFPEGVITRHSFAPASVVLGTPFVNPNAFDSKLSVQVASVAGDTVAVALSFDGGTAFVTVDSVTVSAGEPAYINVDLPSNAQVTLTAAGDAIITSASIF